MKTPKLFIFAALAVLFAACNSNNPSEIREFVPQVQLDEESADCLRVIFSYEQNNKLREFANFQPIIVRSEEELQSLCPEYLTAPKLDFANQCLIFVPIETSSISDEWIDMQLYRIDKKRNFNAVINMFKCRECYTAIGHFYPFGLFDISPKEVSNVSHEIKYINN